MTGHRRALRSRHREYERARPKVDRVIRKPLNNPQKATSTRVLANETEKGSEAPARRPGTWRTKPARDPVERAVTPKKKQAAQITAELP